jgi:TatA/E family protein of Tat protein translocase
MGSLGFPELLLIFAVALIVFGPRKLPEIGRTLGKALGEFRKATDDLKNTIEREVRADELKQIASSSLQSVSRDEPASAPAITVDPAAAHEEPKPAATIAEADSPNAAPRVN